MKIVHLVAGSLSGGAARGAYWLHKGLIKLGVDSTLVTNGRNIDDDSSIISLSDSKVDRIKTLAVKKFNNIRLQTYPNRKSRIFSTGFYGRNLHDHDCIKNADLIHLHWINGLVSIRSIFQFKQPIVWTMRDMWPFTGGCHYSMNCDRYMQGCGSCPQLESSRARDISQKIVRMKLENFKGCIQAVGISHWLTDQASKSTVFADHKPITILNCVDTNIFSPIDKALSRQALNISTNKKLILLGSTNIQDFYKGFNKALEAISHLDKMKYALCIFGRSDSHILDQTGFEYYRLGYLNDNISLRLAYCAADVFLAPSIMEAFGKTLVESLSCGTPVVCFDATGPKSIVEHKIDGYRARPFDAVDMANGVEWVTNNPNITLLGNKGRENVMSKFDSLVIAKEYKKLYERMLIS